MTTNADTAALQEHIAHLNKDLQDLSDVVAKQALTIDLLSRRVGLLMEAEAQRLADSGSAALLGDERPPHY